MTGADSSRKGHFHLVVSGAAFKGWPGRCSNWHQGGGSCGCVPSGDERPIAGTGPGVDRQGRSTETRAPEMAKVKMPVSAYIFSPDADGAGPIRSD